MNNNGWIKIYRKILDNPIICKDVYVLGFWTWLLLHAEYSGERDVFFKNKRITLQPGQVFFKVSQTALELNVNQSKLVRIIENLKNENQIEKQTDNRNTLITLLNWNKYQSHGKQNENLPKTYRKPTEKQAKNIPIIKESKEGEEGKKEDVKDFAPKRDLNFGEAIKFYEKNIRPIDKTTAEKIDCLLSDFGLGKFKSAVLEAKRVGATSFAYIATVCEQSKRYKPTTEDNIRKVEREIAEGKYNI